ncbi:RNA-binding domain-containing protein [Cylindrobasidium torrendii FP15055 ss-10]|uniref:RNA-binding domain-containing protein n=1 Tax=Cylindrobasidium torrendii FP15055 ss-10 TaxID=1314674 RepID=A0A0D7BGP0_9AGAR|nr:RNA-binding domain-containing protein [Cylindrobasidium torrendii FP15055 ss-10]
MPPKKAKKVSLNEFLGDGGLGSWADEMDNLPSAPAARAEGDTGGMGDRPGRRDDFMSSRPDRQGFPPREDLPLPTGPPYTAFIGNLAFDLGESELDEFFSACNTKSTKIIKDRDEKPKGFGYVEFADLDGLKAGLALSGTSFAGRTIRVSVAEPQKERSGFGGDDSKFDNPWRRDGPLPDLPGRGGGGARRGYDRDQERMPSVNEGPNDWRSAMPSRAPGGPADDGARRRKDPAFESSGAADSADNWTMGSRFRASEDAPPSRFGAGRPPRSDGPRGDMGPPPPPREEERDWRAKRPLGSSPTSSNPPTPQMRRKLELLPRTGSGSGTSTPLASPKITPAAPRSNPFGDAKPVDVSAREHEVEVKLDREQHSMSRNSSRTGSQRPASRIGSPSSATPAASQPSSPRSATAQSRAAPANVRPAFSFANAAGNRKEVENKDVDALASQVAGTTV